MGVVDNRIFAAVEILDLNGGNMAYSRLGKHRVARASRILVTFACVAAMVFCTCGIGVIAVERQRKTTSEQSRLSQEQRILHVLNRLGFGARPGDLERVRAMGLENYINQQLSPEKISDAVSEAKVKDLAVLKMTTAELYEKYPQPGQLLRQLERRGEMPAGLAAAREARVEVSPSSTP